MIKSKAGRAATLLAIGLALALLAGCSNGPSAVADRFVSATAAKKFVEASGYLQGDFEGGGQGGQDTSSLLPASAKADFTVTEQSDTTAKAVSQGDSRDYMLLAKSDGNWKITEIRYVEDSETKEAVPFDTNYTDDSDKWEGDDTTTRDGVNGEATYKVTTEIHNGATTQLDKHQVAVLTPPVTAEVTRGTKPRSAGWRTVQIQNYNSTSLVKFRVTSVVRGPGTITVKYESQNADAPTFQPFDTLNFGDGGTADYAGSRSVYPTQHSDTYDERHQPWQDGNPLENTDVLTVPNSDSVTAKAIKVFPRSALMGGVIYPLTYFYPGPME